MSVGVLVMAGCKHGGDSFVLVVSSHCGMLADHLTPGNGHVAHYLSLLLKDYPTPLLGYAS